MKRGIFSIILFFNLLNITLGQSVKGSMVDSANTPVPFCAFGLLKSSDSSLVKGNMTDENGLFIFTNLQSGNYIIRISSIEYKEVYYGPFKFDSISSIILPPITLNKNNINLAEISVVAIKKTIEFKNGMIIMNVEDSPLALGNSVYDLLRRLPGVSIDGEGGINLNGKGAQVIIDGKNQMIPFSQLVPILSGMSGDLVSKIEVMSSPPSKYDASTGTGLINIITKKVKITGISGNVGAKANQGHYLIGSVNGSLNYKGKKYVLFGNFNITDGSRLYTSDFNRTVRNIDTNAVSNATTDFNQSRTRKETQRILSYKVGADFFATKKTTLGFYISSSPSSLPISDKNENHVLGYNNLGFDHIQSYNEISDATINTNYNINAEHVFDTLETKLSFSADYFTYDKKAKQVSENYFYDVNNMPAFPEQTYQTNNISKMDIFTQKIDFSKKISKKINIETGLKNNMVFSSNNYALKKYNVGNGVFELDSNLSTNFFYKENVAAGYITFIKQYKYGSIQFGGRGENTIVDAYIKNTSFKLTRNYFNFFPFLSLDFAKSDKHSFQFSVNSGISRPSYVDLSPYIVINDYYNVRKGNPNLVPQNTYHYSLLYAYNQSVFNTIGFYSDKNYMLTQSYQNDTTKVVANTIENIKGSHYYYYSLFYQKEIKSFWNFTISAFTYFQDYYGKIENVDFYNSNFGIQGSINNDIILPKKFKLQISAFYNSPLVYGIRKYKEVWSLDLAVQKKLLKDNLTIGVGVYDILQKNYYRYESVFKNETQNYANKMDTRRITASISYKFGKIKAQARDVNGNEEEKSRVNSQIRK